MRLLLATSNPTDIVTSLVKNYWNGREYFKAIDVDTLFECYRTSDISSLKSLLDAKEDTLVINRIFGIPDAIIEKMKSKGDKFEFELFMHDFLNQFKSLSAQPNIFGLGGMPGSLISMWAKVADTNLAIPKYFYNRDFADSSTDFDKLEKSREYIFSDHDRLYTWTRGTKPRPRQVNFWIEKPLGVPVQIFKVYDQITCQPLTQNQVLSEVDLIGMKASAATISKLFKQEIVEMLMFQDRGQTVFGMWSNKLAGAKTILDFENALISGIESKYQGLGA